MAEPTPRPWIACTFTKPDGSPILSAEDVAETTAYSARETGGNVLNGVVCNDLDESGRPLTICHTGNGPKGAIHADLIATAVNAHADLLAALREARSELFSWCGEGTASQPVIGRIDAAITKAGG